MSRITLTEILSLYLSQDLLSVFKDTVFHESIKALFDKITAALPPETHNYIDRIRSAFHMGRRPYKDYGRFREIINQVNKAAIEQRSIEIGYQGLKDDSPTLRKINPFKIGSVAKIFQAKAFMITTRGLDPWSLPRLQTSNKSCNMKVPLR